ncbi:MAG TPA: hypothetical protein DEQ09_03685 [Bacteroidales bacterium]|nr:hypothetical protein [Bacteroidales bacterium]
MIDYTQHPLNKKYDLDTALGSIWEFYKKWFGSLFVISFVFSLIITYISGRINISEIYSVTDPEEMIAIARSMIGPYALIILFSFVFILILQYYIIRKPVDTESNIFSIGTTGLVKYFLPLLVLNILLAIFAVFAILIGVFLLFIGALFAVIYVALIYAFISPVLMIENPGIGDTITTTLSLAHKRFWPNIGWVTIFGILVMVISFILGAIIMIPFGGSFFRTIMNPENASELLNLTSKPSFIILNALANAVTMPLFPIFSLVLYFNARSDNIGEVIRNQSDSDKSGPVRVEDLYGNMNKKEVKNNTDSPPPSVEDLMP